MPSRLAHFLHEAGDVKRKQEVVRLKARIWTNTRVICCAGCEHLIPVKLDLYNAQRNSLEVSAELLEVFMGKPSLLDRKMNGSAG